MKFGLCPTGGQVVAGSNPVSTTKDLADQGLFSARTRHERSRLTPLVSASVVLTAAIICAGVAAADPSQQQDQFVALLQQEQIPALDNVPGLVARAHQICGELDGGTPVDAVVNEEMDRLFESNPAIHLIPDRVRRTAVRFITASVDIYCPSHQRELPP
jgi:uncharacterized protein DUF732